ncbi:MAG: trypsin-like serine protease [Phycisphaera sp.]|nr:trypsin-like serine protease [Phycisphaera sp.]
MMTKYTTLTFAASPVVRMLVLLLILCGVPATGLLAADDVHAANLRVTPTVRVFQSCRDAVVNVNTTQIIRQRFGMFGDDSIFRRFFNVRPYDRNVKRTSLGSGFIVHPEGYIVTNAHVVDGADQVEVTLADGSALPARVLASDSQKDLAVIKVDPPAGVKLHAVELGDSSDLLIGEPAIAIGNPLGYEHTVTSGIVSATNRELPLSQELSLKGLIQTDASINPGNSGGPLLNAYGQVIGVNSAIRGDAQNIGFAIPVNHLRDLLPELLSPRTLNHADLGGTLIEKRVLTPPATVRVELMWRAEGDAEDAARPVTTINGQACHTIVDAQVALLRTHVGQTVAMSDGTHAWKLQAKQPPLSDGVRLAHASLGAEVRELNDAECRALGLSRESGLLITSIEREGPAATAGLEAGDVIVQLGRFRVGSLDAIAAVLSQVKEGTPAEIYVIRKGHIGRTRVELRSPNHGSL